MNQHQKRRHLKRIRFSWIWRAQFGTWIVTITSRFALHFFSTFTFSLRIFHGCWNPLPACVVYSIQHSLIDSIWLWNITHMPSLTRCDILFIYIPAFFIHYYGCNRWFVTHSHNYMDTRTPCAQRHISINFPEYVWIHFNKKSIPSCRKQWYNLNITKNNYEFIPQFRRINNLKVGENE